MLFREQGIPITSNLMAFEMAIEVFVETLLPGGSEPDGTAGKPPPKNEKDGKNGSETNSKPWRVYQED